MIKMKKILSLLCLICFIGTIFIPINGAYASSSFYENDPVKLYEKNNVIGHFVHKGPIKGSIYDEKIEVWGNEVNDKWRMEEVTLYEQSDFASPGPNKHLYRTIGFVTMLAKVGEDGELIPLSKGNPHDPQVG